jgi:flagellar motor switch protein FliM
MLSKQLKDAEVEIAARLATTTVTLGQILKMKTGDIIPINIPEKIIANVDEIPLMECRYGQQGGQYALKIERFITPESEDAALGGHND